MGQIQNEVAGIVNKLLVTKAGSELIQSDRETKAMEAQDKANKYFDTELKPAVEQGLNATKKLADATGKKDKVFEKYGVTDVKLDEKDKITDIEGASAMLSENPLARKKQFKQLGQVASDYNTAMRANDLALKEAKFKKDQYETFKERAKLLSGKAKIPMADILQRDAEMDKLLLKAEEWKEKLNGGKKNG